MGDGWGDADADFPPPPPPSPDDVRRGARCEEPEETIRLARKPGTREVAQCVEVSGARVHRSG
eukprot:12101537-Alexandrium_andersonii.AAC.1